MRPSRPSNCFPCPACPSSLPGDDLAAALAAAAPWLLDGDVVVVTSKVLSKCEGRIVPAPSDPWPEMRTATWSTSLRCRYPALQDLQAQTRYGLRTWTAPCLSRPRRRRPAATVRRRPVPRRGRRPAELGQAGHGKQLDRGGRTVLGHGLTPARSSPARTISAVVDGSVISSGTDRTSTPAISARSPSCTSQPSRMPTPERGP